MLGVWLGTFDPLTLYKLRFRPSIKEKHILAPYVFSLLQLSIMIFQNQPHSSPLCFLPFATFNYDHSKSTIQDSKQVKCFVEKVSDLYGKKYGLGLVASSSNVLNG